MKAKAGEDNYIISLSSDTELN